MRCADFDFSSGYVHRFISCIARVRPAFNRNREANTDDSMLVLRCLIPRRIAPTPAPVTATGLPSAAARGEQATVDGGSGAVPSAQVRSLFWGVEAKIAATANGRNVLVVSVCVCVMLGGGRAEGGRRMW